MYDNNNNNKSTILVSLKSHHPGFPTSKIHSFRVIYFQNVWCLFVCLFVLHQTTSGFSGSTFPSVSSFVDWSIQEKIFNKLALSISRLICTLVRAYFCFHPLSYRSFVFSSKHVHALSAVSRFSSIISFNSFFFFLQSASFQKKKDQH